ncbi:hypothetical protein [Oceanomicrobium pacificus]|uniref:Uncharacterized protein n=1 Tax=Oceanomicrobium pacificus TaxID=2692916 RepID=A0A6B0TWQ7_9RHOB|nr:hypothetical protein [Oceanomicrobium pacificus]MXU65443.1 hypothetical protein [Oceanomicrobium pacificus]
MLLLLSLLFFALALVRTTFDWQATVSQGDAFRFSDIGETWFALHPSSLQMFQPAVERYISVWLWESVLQPVLLWPLAPVLAVLGLIFWWLARRKRRRKDKSPFAGR